MSSFVKHQKCKELCQETQQTSFGYGFHCAAHCAWLDAYEEETRRPIFEVRDTDEEARLDRRARARECK